MTLYDLTTEQLVINRLLEENGGELTPELEQALIITEENLSVKTEGYCKAIAIYKGEVETLKAEIDRLTAKKKTAEKAVERMKESLLDCMKRLELEKINAGTFTVSTRKSQFVEILDMDLIPDKYKKEVTTVSVDKNAIKDAFKNNIIVEGAEIKDNKSIQIK